nr:TonB-dependent receptor [Brevundimonas diminuta]
MSNIRSRLLAGSLLSLVGVAAATAAVAQSEPQTTPQDEATSVAEVVVTGTRLRIPDYRGSNPVASVSGQALVNAGVTNVTDFLTDMPALTGSTTLQDNSNAGDRGSVGINLLDLRNLGTQRTLVLVNGRRHVAAQAGSASIDINTIPVALIERVDVMTGGASAVYGADGVSGVVNFVLRDDFEGLDIRAQSGWSDAGGGDNNFISVTAGKNLLDGRANFTVSGEFSKTGRLARDDRDYASLSGRESIVVNPDYTGAPGEYQRIFARNARYIDTSPGGSVYTNLDFADTLSGVDFNGDGTPFKDGLYTSGFTMIGGDGSQLAAFQTDLIPELQRASLNSTFNVEITPKHSFFGEFKYVNTQTQFQSQPSFDYGLFLSIDNPFMPQSIYDAATAPGGIANAIGGVLMARDNFDLGYIMRDVERETYRGVVGFRGDITPNLSYEASLNYGRTIESNTELNNRIAERYYAATDAVRDPLTNQIVCRSNLDPTAIPIGNYPGFGTPLDPNAWGVTFTPGANSGCVAANVFGDGKISQEALDWIMVDSESRSRVEQFVFSAFITGDSEPWFSLPGGPVSFSLGTEYRREKARSTPSYEELLGAQYGYDVSWLGQGVPMSGEFDVTEVFAEIGVPLLRDLPFAKALTVEGAYRFSDYSTVGTTDSYKGGLRWEVNDHVALRGSAARSVRAPNISELFLPRSQTFATLSDPCDDDNYQAGINPAVREANCRAALGYGANDPYTFNNTTSSSVEGVIAGNENLEPETADTFTAGIVLTPSFIPGFSLAIDYYDIKLENAVQFFTAQNIVNKCYDLPQPNQFCSLLTRDAGTNFIDSFSQSGVNVAQYTTSGWDLSVRYVMDPANFGIERDIGRFGFSLTANKLEDLTFTEDTSDPLSSDQTVGQAFVPEWSGNLDLTWEWRKLFVNYGFNYWSETRRYEGRPDDFIAPEYVDYSARKTHDIQVRYTFDERISAYGGVNNVGDQGPDRGVLDYPVNPLGRYFYLGLNYKM